MAQIYTICKLAPERIGNVCPLKWRVSTDYIRNERKCTLRSPLHVRQLVNFGFLLDSSSITAKYKSENMIQREKHTNQKATIQNRDSMKDWNTQTRNSKPRRVMTPVRPNGVGVGAQPRILH